MNNTINIFSPFQTISGFNQVNELSNFITDKTNSDEFKQGYRDNANKYYPEELRKLSERL